VLPRSVAAWVSVAALAALFVPDVLAVRVHVRVEGKTRTIFGATSPLVDVASPETALAALESASALGEFYYHVTAGPFHVDQIGRYRAVGQTAWAYKVNGAVPSVPANEYRLKQGDTVLWFWAQFGIVPGGPKTLLLTRLARTNCYRVVAQDDRRVVTAPVGAVLHVGKRIVRTQGATQAVMACIGPHRGLLVRATLAGAIRSNALP
jgi:hypothetical protein